jgi:hypothetical protein
MAASPVLKTHVNRVRTSLAHDANTTVDSIMEAIDKGWKKAGKTVDAKRRKLVNERVMQCAFLGETDIEKIKAYALR